LNDELVFMKIIKEYYWSTSGLKRYIICMALLFTVLYYLDSLES